MLCLVPLGSERWKESGRKAFIANGDCNEDIFPHLGFASNEEDKGKKNLKSHLQQFKRKIFADDIAKMSFKPSVEWK